MPESIHGASRPVSCSPLLIVTRLPSSRWPSCTQPMQNHLRHEKNSTMTMIYTSKKPYSERQSTNGRIRTRVERAGGRGLLVGDDWRTGTREIRNTLGIRIGRDPWVCRGCQRPSPDHDGRLRAVFNRSVPATGPRYRRGTCRECHRCQREGS